MGAIVVILIIVFVVGCIDIIFNTDLL